MLILFAIFCLRWPVEAIPISTCAATSCLAGYKCVETPTGAKCQQPKAPIAVDKCLVPNESYRSCGGCEPTCANPSPMCIAMCTPGRCMCNQGFYRHNGQCVPASECKVARDEPEAASPYDAESEKSEECSILNEVFRSCGTCEPTCEVPQPACHRMCMPGRCMCSQGFYRHNGQCVPASECPAKDQYQTIPIAQDSMRVGLIMKPAVSVCSVRNEVYRSCGGCEPTCTNQNPICTLACTPGRCMCSQGFVRHNGQCVAVSQCPVAMDQPDIGNTRLVQQPLKIACSDKNEVYRSCGTCEPTCANPTPVCNKMCYPGRCMCNQGYYRHNGQCVPASQCQIIRDDIPQPQILPHPDTGMSIACYRRNEVYRSCGGCEPTCTNQNPICTLACTEGRCMCDQGFYRHNGQCVPINECQGLRDDILQPQILPHPDTGMSIACYRRNEVYRSCGGCEPSCTNQNPICTQACTEGRCMCDQGFYRHNGQCVPINECQAPRDSIADDQPRLQVATMVKPVLPTLTCANVLCVIGKTCRMVDGQPRCLEGVRPVATATATMAASIANDDLSRLRIVDTVGGSSQKCNVRNEVFRSCGGCEPTCNNRNPICTMACNPGRCMCNQGFYRLNGQCVPASQCPVAMDAPEAVPSNDSAAKLQIATIHPQPSKQCAAQNEIFDSCGGCEATCSNQNPICTLSCKPGRCVCDRGFVRHNGQCIPAAKCPALSNNEEAQLGPVYPTTGGCTVRNEAFRSCGGCEPTCNNRNPICTMACTPGRCMCNQGFYRLNGQCVPASQCPAAMDAPEVASNDSAAKLQIATIRPQLSKQCAAQNEIFDSCGGCEATCSNQNPICTLACNPGRCKCDRGFVRHNGQCIPAAKCPALSTQCSIRNEVYRSCGGCEPTCTNQNPICIAMCTPGRCMCDQGFVRHDGQCILATQCPLKDAEEIETGGY